MQTIDRKRLRELYARELEQFTARHPRSAALHQRATGSMVAGVPMPWMARWAGRFPVYVARAVGARTAKASSTVP